MPVGKYYCDYCDKQFQDTLHARKRHLQSSSHLRAKSLWFSRNSNSNTLNSNNTDAGGFVKGLCNRFVKTVLLYFLEIYEFNSFAFVMNNLGLVGFFDVFSCFHLKWWCFFVVLKGFCPYGDSCKYLHTNFATSQGKIFAFMEYYIAGN